MPKIFVKHLFLYNIFIYLKLYMISNNFQFIIIKEIKNYNKSQSIQDISYVA